MMSFNNRQDAMSYLKQRKSKLTVQQYRTIKGQILAGDVSGAKRGIDRVVEKNEGRKGCECHAAQTRHTL